MLKNVYAQFHKDLQVKVNLPELLIVPKRKQIGIAQIDNVLPEFAELFLGYKFFDNSINNKYLITVLYHEFTHILDRVTLADGIEDNKKEKQFLLPYTEFHALKIEMTKRLELFHNPKKIITLSTKVYDEKGIISLKDFLNIQLEQFDLWYKELTISPNRDNIRNLLYIAIYNMGYYAVCSKYNIDDNLFLQNDCISYIKEDIQKLKILLLNSSPTKELCEDSHKIINKISYLMCRHYDLL